VPAALEASYLLGALGALSPGILSFLNDAIDGALRRAREACATGVPDPLAPFVPPPHDEPTIPEWADYGILIGALFLYLLVLGLVVGWLLAEAPRRPAEKHAERTVADLGASRRDLLAALELKRPSYAKKGSPLLFQPPFASSCLVQAAILLLVCACALLFTPYANGANMYSELALAAEPVKLPTFFYLSFLGSVADFWDAGAEGLAVIIGTLAVGWPWLLSVLQLVVLFAPPSLLPPEWAERLLRVCVSTAKLALVDFAMLTQLMIAFQLNVTIGTPPSPTGPLPVELRPIEPTFAEIYIWVTALPAYLASPLGSTALSLLTSMLLVALHTAATVEHRAAASLAKALVDYAKGAKPTAGASDAAGDATRARPPPQRSSLLTHRFAGAPPGSCAWWCTCDPASASPDGAKSDGKTLPPWLCVSVPLVLAASFTLNIYGVFFVDAFTFSFEGVIGALLAPSPSELYSRTITLADIGSRLPEAMGPLADDVTKWVCTGVFFGAVVLTPALAIVVLLLLWLAPLSKNTQRHLARVAEWVYAWSLLDVYAVVVAIGHKGLPAYATYKLSAECERLKGVLPYFDNLIPGENVCLSMTTEVHAGVWIALASSIATIVFGFFTVQIARRIGHEREANEASSDSTASVAYAQGDPTIVVLDEERRSQLRASDYSGPAHLSSDYRGSDMPRASELSGSVPPRSRLSRS